jgi:enamine deaminase RidA (YjgF/YER057c/UK114 family)
MAVAQLTRTTPPRLGLPGSAESLVAQAQSVLAEACGADTAAERFRLAHLAALRTAAAVFAQRGRPAARRRRIVSAWVLLDDVAPEFADWAAYFAAAAPARAAVEAGAVSAVTLRDADDQLRAAQEFLGLVASSLGLLPIPTPLAS